eukprot:TRINITY_DN47142_c0_g1_i1.p1 TRINITY_DN47142_c0_g1~~TRINITY_DN47142_c0_g1_i1.p1  ORF type:complete len:364 (+),score=54.04 TRINITY_DN47142_c0_g1_i1:46-1137(+)
MSWFFGGREESEDSESGEDGDAFHDNYEIGAMLGKGGFGSVHRCTKIGEDDEFAVKIINTESEASQGMGATMSASEEAEIMKRLHHDNIIRILDVFDEDPHLYVVMEQVVGGELLAALNDARHPVNEADMANVCRQVLDALNYLHYQLIVHRDIKAENVLLDSPPSERGLEGSVKVIDFGLAGTLQGDPCSLLEVDGKQLDLVCGTPHYMAPEVWSSGFPTMPDEWKEQYGNMYGPKVDVWATGVMIYLAMFGTFPFNGTTPPAVMGSSCSPDTCPEYRPAKQIPGYNVSERCVDFLENVLEKDQNERLTAREALRTPWLSEKTRAVSAVLPQDLRFAAGAAQHRAKAQCGRFVLIDARCVGC